MSSEPNDDPLAKERRRCLNEARSLRHLAESIEDRVRKLHEPSARTGPALMRVVTTDGRQDLDVVRPEAQALVAAHIEAIDVYLRTGTATRLASFEGLSISGQQLETDPDRIVETWTADSG